MPLTFFAEISCVTSPVSGTPFLNDGPRITRTGVPIEGIKYDLDGKEPPEPSPYLRIRELELINGYHKYDIRIGAGRHFIAFKDVRISDPHDFYDFAKTEIAKINRVLNSTYPSAAKILLSNTICIAVNDTTIQPYWKESDPLYESAEIQVVEEQDVVDNWNKYLKSVLQNRSGTVFRLFDLEDSCPTVAACIALISQNTFPAFYNVYEIIVKEYGGKPEFIKIGHFTKKEISDFTNNAQVARHADRIIGPNTKPMGTPEAKLFVIRMLDFYIEDRCKGASSITRS